MTQSQPKQTVIGKITSVYGIKGWVKVLSYTDPLENLLGYRQVDLVASAQTGALPGGQSLKKVLVEGGKLHGKGLIVKLKGYDDPESVRPLCGSLLAVDVEQFPELEDGEYYWHQLEGLKVMTMAGEELGVVDHLLETGANDVLVVRGIASSLDQRERLIPYLPDQVVMDVDLAEGVIRVDWDPEF